MEIYTIGFTQTTAEHFFTRLAGAGIERLLDVRLNNTSQLAGFAKAQDLPYFARELAGATYEHQPLLAPTQDILDAYKKRRGDWATYDELRIAFGKLYLMLGTPHTTAHVRVTDIRFYDSDQEAIKRDVVRDVNQRLAAGKRAYAMLGLARAIPDDEAGDVHWLMANGLCLADRAVSDLP
jgi:hypothetical protein